MNKCWGNIRREMRTPEPKNSICLNDIEHRNIVIVLQTTHKDIVVSNSIALQGKRLIDADV